MYEILHLIFRPEVIVFMIPLSAIIGGFYLASIKAKAKLNAAGLSKEDRQLMASVLRENKDVKNRLENLESIITSMDKELLTLRASNDAEVNQERVKRIATQMKDDSPA